MLKITKPTPLKMHDCKENIKLHEPMGRIDQCDETAFFFYLYILYSFYTENVRDFLRAKVFGNRHKLMIRGLVVLLTRLSFRKGVFGKEGPTCLRLQESNRLSYKNFMN